MAESNEAQAGNQCSPENFGLGQIGGAGQALRGALSKNHTTDGRRPPPLHPAAGWPALPPTVTMEVPANLDFSQALAAMKYRGKRIARAGWNGKGQWVYLQNCPEGSDHLPHAMMHNAQGKRVPWLPSQPDMLADDWAVLPD